MGTRTALLSSVVAFSLAVFPSISRAGPQQIEMGTQSTEVKRYLEAIHEQIEQEWSQLLARCQAWLPASHPANNRKLRAVVEVRLDENGQPDKFRLYESSGYADFDKSALGVFSSISRLPQWPRSAGEGYGIVRWSFHRDRRACSPAYAKLATVPFPPPVAMRRALAQGDWTRARKVLEEHGDVPEVVQALVEAGLSSADADVLRLAAGRAATARLTQQVLDPSSTPPQWRAALQALEARGEQEQLRGLLRRLLTSGQFRVERPTAQVEAILAGLVRLGAALPSDLLEPLLASDSPAVTVSSVCLVRSVGALVKARPVADNLMQHTVIRLRRFALGDPKVSTAEVAAALTGKQQKVGWAMLERCPVARFAPALVELTQKTGLSAATRVRAVRALGRAANRQHAAGQDATQALIALYRALEHEDQAVQQAAVQSLGHISFAKKSVSYRLADAAYHGKVGRQVAALAVANIVVLGVPRFQADVRFLMGRLPSSGRAVVLRELWRYGETMLSTLERMSRSPDSAVRQAALRSLARIPTPSARQVLQAAERRAGAERPDPLARLLLAARTD